MKHLSLLFRFVLVSLVMLGGAVGAAHAAPAVAVHKCRMYNCNSATSLKNEARLAGASLPLGSIVFVSSSQHPLSAFVRMCTGPRGVRDGCMITMGDFGAAELDNEVYARATAIEPIDIPPDIAPSATGAIYELVESWIFRQGLLIHNGRFGTNPWHDLFDPSTWVWMEIYDERTGVLNKVYTRDRITVRFRDGSTAQLEMMGPYAPSGHFFHWVSGSEQDRNGNPFVVQPTPPAAAGSGGFDLAAPWLDGSFYTELVAGLCAFLESTCEAVNPYEVNCYYRRKQLPCA
jgi:hypothetical protein